MSHDDKDDTFPCPHCGAEVRAGASFCRACGASDDSGWNEEDSWSDDASGTGCSEAVDDFDYDEYIRREFPEHASFAATRRLKQMFVALVVILLCAALLMWQLM
ncbi:MAG: zinc ribbon domain-containing protein [Pirellulaceae bacterium]